MTEKFDALIVGAGIVGLAHAVEAARRGLRVAIVERDHFCIGASVRNFGFITVTGQPEGETWRRARRTRDLWLRITSEASIPIEQRGLWVIGRRKAAAAVLEEFLSTDMGRECRVLCADEIQQTLRYLNLESAAAVLYSPHEIRVESRVAIPRIAEWLERVHGVRIFWGTTVVDVQADRVLTNFGPIHAERIVVCPGTDLTGVIAPWIADLSLRLTRLQMLRVKPHGRLDVPSAVMSDLSLVRYGGYAARKASAYLMNQLAAEEAEALEAGIHLIAVQSADGTFVIGDSHHEQRAAQPFASEKIDQIILRLFAEAIRVGDFDVVERWVGTYPVGFERDALIRAPHETVRLVLVTSGTGASTAFGIAEEVFETW